jgi:hypothetical protein
MKRFLCLILIFVAQRAHAADPCANRGTSIVVLTAQRLLHRCEQGRSTGTYPVALGKGGLGKQRQGDGRTPLGSYPLGAPRPSAKFWTFIPVAYPTAAQRRLGYTGGAVGVHGPPKKLLGKWIGRLFDWTAGCIAVKTREEIEELADWARRAHPVAIHLE